MTPIQEVLSGRIKSLEKELQTALEEKEKAFQYRWANGKVRFEKPVLEKHRSHKYGLPSYLLHGRFLAYLTAPVIYSGIVPFFLLDLFLTVYQGICFPIYGVPKVRRADYLIFDRAQLKYLNLLERLNCAFCSYGNGLFAYGVEIAAEPSSTGVLSSTHSASAHPIRATRISSITATPPTTATKSKPSATISST